MKDKPKGKKANCQAVFFGIKDARQKAKLYGIKGDDDGKIAKRLLYERTDTA